MSDSVERFSDRVENYVKYRPSYPPEVLGLFVERLGLTHRSAVADIGSGTGISSRLFLENGNTVYGIEPNAKMREAAEEYLREFHNFRSVNGTAAATSMPNDSVDLVIAAQAFHWFDAGPARTEFERILKPDGWVALIWNERKLDSTPFLKEYESFLLKFGRDYATVRHDKIDETSLAGFLGPGLERATFANAQVLDFEGLKGRVLSSSYMPSEADEAFRLMNDELETLFAKHSESGRITLFYDTNVFYAQF